MESQACTSSLKVGQIVWAKLRGWPWWPAKVEQIDPEEDKPVIVRFFTAKGDLGFMKSNQVVDFKKGVQHEKCHSGKRFLYAVSKAKEMIGLIEEPCGENKEGSGTSSTQREQTDEDGKTNKLVFKKVQVMNQNQFQKVNLTEEEIKQSNLNKRPPVKLSDITNENCKELKQNSYNQSVKVGKKPLSFTVTESGKSSVISKQAGGSFKEQPFAEEDIYRLKTFMKEITSQLQCCYKKQDQSASVQALSKLDHFCEEFTMLTTIEIDCLVKQKVGYYLTNLREVIQSLPSNNNQALDSLASCIKLIKTHLLRSYKERRINESGKKSPYVASTTASLSGESKKKIDKLLGYHRSSKINCPSSVETALTVLEEQEQRIDTCSEVGTPIQDCIEPGTQNMSSVQIKKEEITNENSIMSKLRIRACRKMYRIIHEQLGMPAKDAQPSILNFEKGVNEVFPGIPEYLHCLKTICRGLRANTLSLSEFKGLSELNGQSIKLYFEKYSSQVNGQ